MKVPAPLFLHSLLSKASSIFRVSQNLLFGRLRPRHSYKSTRKSAFRESWTGLLKATSKVDHLKVSRNRPSQLNANFWIRWTDLRKKLNQKVCWVDVFLVDSPSISDFNLLFLSFPLFLGFQVFLNDLNQKRISKLQNRYVLKHPQKGSRF